MKQKTKIEVIKGETPNSKIYIMTLPVDTTNLYELAKQKRRFMESETRVLEMVIEGDLREFLKGKGIIPKDGSQESLQEAFNELERDGFNIEIRDRYYEINNEQIVGESPNRMTVILENSILSCALEVEINETY